MKKFTEAYKNELKVVTEGLEPEVRETFKEIEGKVIDECCCDCCCSEPKCCEPCIGSCLSGNCCQDDKCFKISFYSETDILKKLETNVTVQDMYNIRSQFNLGQAYLPSEANEIVSNAPLFFVEKGFTNIEQGGVMQAHELRNNKAILSFIRSISKKYGIGNVIVVSYLTGGAALFGIKHTGTNGEEGSIKNSLLEVYNTLDSLQQLEEVSNASVCNVSIDSCDDVYAFLFRISLDRVFLTNIRQ